MDLNFEERIAKGAFGKVFRARLSTHSTKYAVAVKQLSKILILEQRSVPQVLDESDFSSRIYHPFIVQTYFGFQDKYYLYLVMEYFPYDLRTFIRRRKTLSQVECKWFAAQIVIALEHLHAKRIVHRDLKPGNILLNDSGFLALADFGISKRIFDSDNKVQATSGTKGYMSPEILKNERQSYEVDWFSFGVCIYYMCFGCKPFGKNKSNIKERTLTGKFSFPMSNIERSDGEPISRELKSIICELLKIDPKKRLGKNGSLEVKQHNFFKNIPWKELELKQIDFGKFCSLYGSSNNDGRMDVCEEDDAKSSPSSPSYVTGSSTNHAGFHIIPPSLVGTITPTASPSALNAGSVRKHTILKSFGEMTADYINNGNRNLSNNGPQNKCLCNKILHICPQEPVDTFPNRVASSSRSEWHSDRFIVTFKSGQKCEGEENIERVLSVEEQSLFREFDTAVNLPVNYNENLKSERMSPNEDSKLTDDPILTSENSSNYKTLSKRKTRFSNSVNSQSQCGNSVFGTFSSSTAGTSLVEKQFMNENQQQSQQTHFDIFDDNLGFPFVEEENEEVIVLTGNFLDSNDVGSSHSRNSCCNKCERGRKSKKLKRKNKKEYEERKEGKYKKRKYDVKMASEHNNNNNSRGLKKNFINNSRSYDCSLNRLALDSDIKLSSRSAATRNKNSTPPPPMTNHHLRKLTPLVARSPTACDCRSSFSHHHQQQQQQQQHVCSVAVSPSSKVRDRVKTPWAKRGENRRSFNPSVSPQSRFPMKKKNKAASILGLDSNTISQFTTPKLLNPNPTNAEKEIQLRQFEENGKGHYLVNDSMGKTDGNSNNNSNNNNNNIPNNMSLPSFNFNNTSRKHHLVNEAKTNNTNHNVGLPSFTSSISSPSPSLSTVRLSTDANSSLPTTIGSPSSPSLNNTNTTTSKITVPSLSSKFSDSYLSSSISSPSPSLATVRLSSIQSPPVTGSSRIGQYRTNPNTPTTCFGVNNNGLTYQPTSTSVTKNRKHSLASIKHSMRHSVSLSSLSTLCKSHGAMSQFDSLVQNDSKPSSVFDMLPEDIPKDSTNSKNTGKAETPMLCPDESISFLNLGHHAPRKNKMNNLSSSLKFSRSQSQGTETNKTIPLSLSETKSPSGKGPNNDRMMTTNNNTSLTSQRSSNFHLNPIMKFHHPAPKTPTPTAPKMAPKSAPKLCSAESAKNANSKEDINSPPTLVL
eukprot:TRINITY_DN1338_c2_g1_i3.p1 TRINITY_DN1338_c2_g1~~TRINITY_DN1338_c2_g1_i3.p1  ORF type:complete len:1205 (-),score=307.70 TRINITY_DN1338_c2_g1_i3:957-4571(-)